MAPTKMSLAVRAKSAPRGKTCRCSVPYTEAPPSIARPRAATGEFRDDGEQEENDGQQRTHIREMEEEADGKDAVERQAHHTVLPGMGWAQGWWQDSRWHRVGGSSIQVGDPESEEVQEVVEHGQVDGESGQNAELHLLRRGMCVCSLMISAVMCHVTWSEMHLDHGHEDLDLRLADEHHSGGQLGRDFAHHLQAARTAHLWSPVPAAVRGLCALCEAWVMRDP